MSHRSRKRILLATVTGLLASALWLYFERVPRIDLATRVPDSAIGYLEVNDWPRFMDQLTESAAWLQLAPEFGLWDKWRYLGKAAWILRTTGIGPREAVVLARAQLALVVTSLEVRGEEVRPRLAFVLETHSREAQLAALIQKRLPQLANHAFGTQDEERSEYAGILVTVFRGADRERRMLSAQIGSEWIVANHAEAMEACIDARLGRVPAMANNFYLQNGRPVVGSDTAVFGFVSGEGTIRLTHFAAELVGSRLFGNSPLTEALRSVVSDLSSIASHGLAYGMGFGSGQAVERYAWLCHPQMAEQLRGVIRVKGQAMRLPGFAPASIEGMTIIRVEDPDRAFSAAEAVISSRLGAAQSFILHRFVLGAREALFGLKEQENAAAAFGDEMGSISFGPTSAENLWVVTVKDRPLLERLTARFLTQGGATMRTEASSGTELWISSDERRGAVGFFKEFLVIGGRQALLRLVEARKTTGVIAESPRFLAALQPASAAPMVSFSSVRAETQGMMDVLANFLPRGGARGRPDRVLANLPLATSTLQFADQSLLVESHSSFGSLPFMVSILSQKPEGGAAAK